MEKHFKFIKDQSKVFDDNGFFNEIARLLNSFFDTEQFSLYTYFSNPKAVKSYLYDYNNDFELESFIEKIQEYRNNEPGKNYYES